MSIVYQHMAQHALDFGESGPGKAAAAALEDFRVSRSGSTTPRLQRSSMATISPSMRASICTRRFPGGLTSASPCQQRVMISCTAQSVFARKGEIEPMALKTKQASHLSDLLHCS